MSRDESKRDLARGVGRRQEGRRAEPHGRHVRSSAVHVVGDGIGCGLRGHRVAAVPHRAAAVEVHGCDRGHPDPSAPGAARRGARLAPGAAGVDGHGRSAGVGGDPGGHDERGGTGETSDWEFAKAVVALRRPVVLAGGLTPEKPATKRLAAARKKVSKKTAKVGKIARLEAWLASEARALQDFARSTFYSDSRNDLPLLERVTHPVAVDPDDTLRAHARERGWPIISLRD